MAYELVVDPITGEEKYEWKSGGNQTLQEKRIESDKRTQAAATPISYSDAAKVVPRMFVNAGINAVQEGSDTIRDVGGFFGIGEGTTAEEPDKPILGLGEWKPEPLESSGAIEDFGTGVLQFGLEWVTLSKFLKGANWGLKGLAKTSHVGKYVKPISTGIAKVQSKTKKLELALAKTPVVGKPLSAAANATLNPKGLIVDFAGFDQYEGRLYDLAANTKAFEWIENVPVINQLKTDPDDDGLQGRAKNALEGWGIDFGAGSIIRTLRGKWAIEDLAKQTPGTPEFETAAAKVREIETELSQDPVIAKQKEVLARQNKQITTRDRAAFDKALAHLPIEQRDALWKQTRQKLGKPVEQPDFGTKELSIKKENRRLTQIPALRNNSMPRYVVNNIEEFLNTKIGVSPQELDLFREGGLPIKRIKQIEELVRTEITKNPDAPFGINETNQVYDFNLADELNYLAYSETIDVSATRSDLKQLSSIKEDRGVKTVTGDLDSIRRQIEELGPEPPKPAKGKSIVNGKHTPEYKTWNKWNRTNKSLQAKLKELEQVEGTTTTDVDIDPREASAIEAENEAESLLEEGFRWTGSDWVDAKGNPVGPEQFAAVEAAQQAFKEKVSELANALEKGDLPYFRTKTSMRKKGVDLLGDPIYQYKQEVVLDEDIANALIEGKSISEIIDNLELNNPRGAGLGEGKGVSLKHHRGAEQIKEQLRAHVNKQGLEVDEVRTIEKFIDMIGDDMFDDVSFSFFKKIKARGRFAFGRNLLEINSKILEEGGFTRTMVHELWHSLSRYLPAKDLKAYTKEFKKAQTNYINKTTKRLVDLNETVEGFKIEVEKIDIKAHNQKADELLWKRETADGLTDLEKAELEKIFLEQDLIQNYDRAKKLYDIENKIFNDFVNGDLYTRENYRFSQIDEYFAEMLTDQLFLKHWKKADLAASGTFTRVIQEIGLLFKDLWINLKAQLGGPRTEKIFNDFIKGKNTKQIREYALDYDEADAKGLKGLWDELATEILDESALGVAVSEKSDLVQRLYRNMEDSLVVRNMPEEFNKGNIPDDTSFTDKVKRVGDDFLENMEKVKRGEIDIDNADLYRDQDVAAVRKRSESFSEQSPDEKIYQETTPEVEMLYDSISKQVDRIKDTGILSTDNTSIVDTFIKRFEAEGINLQEIIESKGITEIGDFMRDHPEIIEEMLRLRIGLDISGKETAKYAANIINADVIPDLDYGETMKSFHESLEMTLKYSREYRTWTRTAGRMLQATQTPIPSTAGIDAIKTATKVDQPKVKASLKEPVDTLNNLPEEYLRALETGEWTPEAESIAWQLVTIGVNPNTTDGIKTLEKFINGPSPLERARKKVDADERIGKALANWRVNQILSAAKTIGVNASAFVGMIAEPAKNMAIRGISERSLHASNMAMQQFRYYMRYAYGALKLGRHSFETGMSLYDPGRKTASWVGDMADEAYEKGRASQVITESHPSYDLNVNPITRELKQNPITRMFDLIWKGGTITVRGMQALETVQRALVGNSLLHTIGIEEGLAQASRRNIEAGSKEAWRFAEEWATAKVKFYTQDAVINGVTIEDAIMRDETAIQIGRILTFTNDVRARVPQRSKAFGMELAKKRGEIDPVAIEKAGDDWVAGKVNNPLLKLYNRATRLDEGLKELAGPKKLKEGQSLADIPEVGAYTPTGTMVWSAIPEWWGKLQASRIGYVASFIQPFNRTPADITKQWLRMIPGLNLTTDTFYADLFNESGYISNRWMGEVATGSVVLGFLGGQIFNEDFPIEFTGFGPNSGDMRTTWEMTNRRPTSWRYRWKDTDGEWRYGEWRSYRAFEPVATLIAGIADYKMLYADLSEEERDEAGVALTVSLASQVLLNRFSASYYQGIIGFVDQFSEGGYGRRELEPGERSKFDRGVQRFFLSFAPQISLAREFRQSFDQEKRFVPASKEATVIDWDNGLTKGVDNYGNDTYINEPTASTESETNRILTQTMNFGSQFMDELKNNTPGFSDQLPARTNWITNQPLYNPGFLGSDQVPGEDAPWLFSLTERTIKTVFGNLVGDYSIGKKGRKTDAGYPPKTSKDVIVMEEMLKLSQKGNVFVPPRPTDFGKNINLSYPAFKQYKTYIATVKNDTGDNLAEALHREITSPKYKSLLYINHPVSEQDTRIGYTKKMVLEKIIEEFKSLAKTKFRKDVNNPYSMEVLRIEQLRESNKLDDDIFLEGGVNAPHPDQYPQTDNMRQNGSNAQSFSDQLNQ